MVIQTKSLLAKTGEALSVEFLQHLGYRLIVRNYHSAFGEIDIVLQDKSEIVFVEVKTRTSHNLSSIQNSITISKRKKLTRTALYFLHNHPESCKLSCRFDLMLVFYYPRDDTYKLMHHKDAFAPIYTEN